MYKNLSIVAIIPARSGSKGLVDKNIKLMNGKPMMAYTIEASLKSKVFDEVVVSTDSEEYAEIARKYGASIPFLRPEHLSNDTASSKDVIVHLLDELEKSGKEYDAFVLLQPTSPLRDEKDIINAVEIFVDKKANAVVSVCEAEHSPLLANTLGEEGRMDDFLNSLKDVRRQDLPDYYRLNGAIYMASVDYYKEYGDFYRKDSFAYVMDTRNSIDIDNELDFDIAEYLIMRRT